MSYWPKSGAASLTGGIGSGKSTVLKLFSELGADVWSADDAYSKLTAPGSELVKTIAAEFGPEVLRSDGSLNRPKLAAIVFTSTAARRSLELITHPPILDDLDRRLRERLALPVGQPVLVAEIPLLFEAGLQNSYRPVILVTAATECRVLRLAMRDGLSADAVQQRLDAQMQQEDKVSAANYVVCNSGSPAELKQKVMDVWSLLNDGHAPYDA